MGLIQQNPRLIAIGAIAPFYIGITNAGKLYSLEQQAGRPVCLVHLGSLNDRATAGAFLASFAGRKNDFATLGADVVFLTTDKVDVALNYTLENVTLETIGTDDTAFVAACGASPAQPLVLVLSAGAAVLGAFPNVGSEAAPDLALKTLAAIPGEPSRDIVLQAPVLLIHNVIGRAFCRELIELHDKGGHFDSGFMTIDNNNRPQLKIDHAVKKREDHYIQPDHPMNLRLLNVVVDRIAPEIKKAFHVQVAHCERFLIGCYENDGHFRRHRDDSGAANAHRQFAITLNLNTEDYEGGYLTFPEYGPHRYRPQTGDAVVFSGTLLHEATPVTRGRRFALLGFLHSAEAEARHQAYRENARLEAAAPARAAVGG